MSTKAGYRIVHENDALREGDVNGYSAATLEVIDSEVKLLLHVS